MSKDELILEIGALLIRDGGLVSGDWQSLRLVSRIEAGTPDMSGICYDAQGIGRAVAPRNFDVFDRLESLRSLMASDDGRAWQACRIRIDRGSAKINLEFDY
jgi:hypothetical protein